MSLGLPRDQMTAPRRVFGQSRVLGRCRCRIQGGQCTGLVYAPHERPQMLTGGYHQV